MANIPLALVGAVVGLWLSGQPLSVAALVGFITLAGIAMRNGILKVSHYINLCGFEGEALRPADDRARLARAADAGADDGAGHRLRAGAAAVRGRAPGKEILHPVAVVIFGGLISSTLLDTFLTPVMFWLFGREDAERLMEEKAAEALF